MVKVKNDLTGQTFGRLTVIERAEDYVTSNGKHSARWLCKCQCGNVRTIRHSQLTCHGTKSCGCLTRELSRQRAIERNSKGNDYEFDGDVSKCYFSNCDGYFLFDTEDYDKIKDYTWAKQKSTGYVCSRSIGTFIRVHRLIMDCPKDMVVDHINHNTSDNRKCNLRVCTQAENSANRHYHKHTNTNVRGVYLLPNGRYGTQIKVKQKNIYLGRYDTLEEAKLVRQRAEQEYFGEFVLKE